MDKNISLVSCTLYFLPVPMRVPLKFGAQTLEAVTCARVKVSVKGSDGRVVEGWGETPISVAWVWPSDEPYDKRENILLDFCTSLSQQLPEYINGTGHPIELSVDFINSGLEELLERANQDNPSSLAIPHLAGLVCYSAFDIALHDAYGKYHNISTYETYNSEFMNRDLSELMEPGDEAVSFKGKYPSDYLKQYTPQMPVWHLVGGLDPLTEADCDGSEPNDNYPVSLDKWIENDGLTCLKIKLRGNDQDWDLQRIIDVGDLSLATGVKHLTVDFNCMVYSPTYVDEILDQLRDNHPAIYDLILYVEQPFPYDIEAHPIDVSSTSSRKLLLMDESAHDWRYVKMGYELGWTGVALKTCKTQSGALLSMSWARAHDMALMVQDLTNPMLAQIPHVLLAANCGTIMGVESNGMQFYPDASLQDLAVHPGIYQRRNGILDLSTLSGPGFGYRIEEVNRELPEPEAKAL